MRQTIIIIFSILIFDACNTSSDNSTSRHSEFYVKDYKDKFKHKDIVKFPRCGINDLNGSRPIQEIHTPITGELAFKVFQDNIHVSDTINEWTKVLYSIQNNKGHQAILLGGMDDDWVDKLIYYSYDKNGKFISKLTLYECGGDGGYTTVTYGEFKDSLYSRTTVNCELKDDESTEVICDSVTNKFILHFNGKFEDISK